MRRRLPLIAAAAVVAAVSVLLLLASLPPVARAPTAAPAGTSRPPASSAPPRGTTSPSVSVSAQPSGSPSPRTTPAPGSASLPPDVGPTPEGYRPPPDTFDASSVKWAGDAVSGSSQEKRFGLWTAGLDGRDLQQVATGELGTGPSVVAPDGAVAFIQAARAGPTPLLLARAGADPVPVLPWVTEIALGPPGEVLALAVRPDSDGHAVDDGVWIVPTSGADPYRLSEGTGQPSCNAQLFGDRTRSGVAANEAFAASGVCVAGDGDAFSLAIELLERKAQTDAVVDVDARPLGFDRSGRLVAQSDQGFVAIAPSSGSPSQVPGDAGGQARVTRGGRWLVTFSGGEEVVAYDLANGGEARWELAGGSTFDLTGFGDETHVVLESFVHLPGGELDPGWHAVVDLAEGWIGYLPPIAPLRDDPPE